MTSASQQQYQKGEDDAAMPSKFWGKIISNLELNHMFSQGWRQNKGILEHATFQEIIANYPFLGGYWRRGAGNAN